MRKRCLLCILTFVIVCIILLRLLFQRLDFNAPSTTNKFDNFDNVTGAQKAIVPDVVQQPEVVYIHTDAEKFGGHYWTVLQTLSFPDTSLVLSYRPRPTHVFGQPLSSLYHSSDVARIQVLMECGGIYIDGDTLILRPLNHFRHFEMAVGWPMGEYMGTQVLVAHKDARFLPLWLNTYRRYRPRDWYYNAGQQPTQQILEKKPYLVHRVPGLFGVQNLASRLYGRNPWPQWHLMFTIHLLSRHAPAPRKLDEKFVVHYRAPFGDIARWLLYKEEPKVKFPEPGDHYIYNKSTSNSICSVKGDSGFLR